MKIELSDITPAMAKSYLSQNIGNFRPLDKKRVKLYSGDMQAGKWDVNGESIKFNGHELIDGQHRLAAIVESGMTIRMVVVNGVQSAMNVDTGKSRGVKDWLRHIGVKQATTVAAMARMGLVYESGFWNQHAVNARHTNPKVIQFATTYLDELTDALHLAARAKKIMTPSMLGVVMFFGCGKKYASNVGLCNWFVTSLEVGENLDSHEPVLHLRNRMVAKGRQYALPSYMQRMLLTLAWNKTVSGLSIANLKLTTTGPTKQEMPNVISICDDDE